LAVKKKTTAKKKTVKKQALKWPGERNIFFRPERLKYVKKMLKIEGCVFCQAQKEISFETLCVYKTKHSQIVLNKYPYNNGHLLVLPLAHVGQLLDLSPERYDDLHQTLRLAVQAIQTVYQPTGYNIGLNNGATAGAGIPDHMHYHIVPRWSGDLNFFPLIANTKLVIETLEDSYAQFREYFKKVKG
jgi:ATP adenylyltransferase